MFHRDLFCRTRLYGIGQHLRHLCLNKSRRYRVHGDAPAGHFSGKGFCQSDHTGLGRTVIGLPRIAEHTGNGRNIDDSAASLFDHLAGYMLHAVKYAL